MSVSLSCFNEQAVIAHLPFVIRISFIKDVQNLLFPSATMIYSFNIADLLLIVQSSPEKSPFLIIYPSILHILISCSEDNMSQYPYSL
jgi:hypothetical protein